MKITLGAETPHHASEIEVDLFGRLFAVRPVTRSVQIRYDEVEAKLRDATDGDQAVAAFAQMLDVLLKSTNGQKKTAGAVIREKWDANELSVGQINEFVEQVQEAATEARPT